MIGGLSTIRSSETPLLLVLKPVVMLPLILAGIIRADVHVFRGSSDASAAVAIQENLFVVADDENNLLRIYQTADRDMPVFSYDMSAFLETDTQHPEADIEAATRVGDRIYWITSHGRNRDGKYRMSRCRFFATRLKRHGQDVSLVPEGRVCKTLAWDLTAQRDFRQLGLDRAAPRDISMTKRQRKKLAPKQEGLNIEGLCASVDGRTLYIGLRNPRPGQRAVVVPLLNPAAVIESNRRPEFGPPILWNLRNLGIRAMTYSSFHRAYFIIAGSHQTQGAFVLYRWSGARTDPPQAVQQIDLGLADLAPEALVAFAGRPKLWLLSDDGARLVKVSGPQDCLPGEFLGNGTCQNKHLLDARRKTFRGVWLPVSSN